MNSTAPALKHTVMAKGRLCKNGKINSCIEFLEQIC